MIRKHPIVFSLLILIVAGAAAGVIYARRPRPVEVRLAEVERVDSLKETVNASGAIRADELVDIQAEVPGVIVELPVKEGQTVHKGDVLLKIDPFQSETDLASARARAASAQADVKRAEATIATAEANLARERESLKTSEAELEQAEITMKRDRAALERQVKLRDNGTISADMFEEFESKAKVSASRAEAARARIDETKAQLRASELTVEQNRAMKTSAEQNYAAAEAALRRAQDQLSKVTICSPLDGTIVRLNVDVGERAVPGIQSNPQATLMTIANLSVIEAEIQVDETDIVHVSIGDQAKISVDALPDTPLEGHVTEIGSAPIQDMSHPQEGKDFNVVAVIEDPPPSLRVGMSCEADITADTRQNVLAIPIQALTTRLVDVDTSGSYIPPPRPEKKAGKKEAPKSGSGTAQAKSAGANKKNEQKELQGVFVKGDDNFAHFRPVKTGIMGGTKAEVLEGLKEGERVITGPLKSLRELDEWTGVRETEDKKQSKE